MLKESKPVKNSRVPVLSEPLSTPTWLAIPFALFEPTCDVDFPVHQLSFGWNCRTPHHCRACSNPPQKQINLVGFIWSVCKPYLSLIFRRAPLNSAQTTRKFAVKRQLRKFAPGKPGSITAGTAGNVATAWACAAQRYPDSVFRGFSPNFGHGTEGKSIEGGVQVKC